MTIETISFHTALGPVLTKDTILKGINPNRFSFVVGQSFRHQFYKLSLKF